ncbi:MAG: hypothetical protein CMD26_03950 [Flavobacteriales bacterium]|nr:hypothetical protein [Flavobacteriales bacterium]|tara:strand:+ start:3389 stop:4219 length:831 start_codon:yes stop_codon:yes gene_type:complete
MNYTLYKIIIYLFVFSYFNLAFTQEDDFLEEIKLATQLAESVLNSETNNEREIANEQLKLILLKIVSEKKSYLHEFEKIEHISILQPKDKKFKIISWFLPYTDGTYKYFGIIQKCNKRGKKCQIYLLEDQITLSQDYLQKTIQHDEWYGCLYYDVIPIKIGKENYYTLLGWDGHNFQTSKKIIDVLKIVKKQDPFFGASIFNNDNKRLVIEYASKYPISLKYDPKLEYIVFDHLEPIDEISINNFSIYATNLSYDVLKKTKFGWILEKEIYLNNQK